jgi:flagellar operon protein
VSVQALDNVTARRSVAELHEALAGRRLRFSSHAARRMTQRDLELDDSQLARLADGVERAAVKGSRSALIMVDHVAMVVAVPNRTVITAIRTGSAAGGLFTNIDSAVVA